MIVNVSALETWLACRKLWHNKYELGRGYPEDDKEYFVHGKRWHAIAAGEASIAETDPWWMQEGYNLWLEWLTEHPDFKIIAKEMVLEAPMSQRHRLLGRLDGLAIWNNQHWHVQYKTLRANASIVIQAAVKKNSYHEQAYRWLAEAHAFKPWGGTLLVTVRKLKKGIPLVVDYLPADDEQTMLGTVMDIIEYADEMEKLPRIRNRKACFGQFESRLCQYYKSCFGNVSINDYPEMEPLKDYHK